MFQKMLSFFKIMIMSKSIYMHHIDQFHEMGIVENRKKKGTILIEDKRINM